MGASLAPASWDEAQLEYRGKIKTFARNGYRQLPGYDLEDLEQELLVVLWTTLQKFDSNRGVKFNTLVQTNFKNRIITLIRHANTQSRKASMVSLDEDAVRSAVEERIQGMDAESQALLRIELVEAIEERGIECLNGPKRGRRRRAA